MAMTHTYTYALMEVSESAFNEVKEKLLAADYGHAIVREEPNLHLNMNGLALVKERVWKEPEVEVPDTGLVGIGHGGAGQKSALVLCGEDGKLLVDVRMDGTVIFGPDFSPEPAARLLFQCFAQLFPH